MVPGRGRRFIADSSFDKIDCSMMTRSDAPWRLSTRLAKMSAFLGGNIANAGSWDGLSCMRYLAGWIWDEKRLSAISQAVDLLRRHCDGFRPGPWVVHPLSPGDYAEVLGVLEVDKALKDYVEDKARLVRLLRLD
ncbi:hypothetical protein VTN00DRAFT_2395 [Thermoascus crustaceus]|uniref:uncharacterized protein n=1 Tax=Thermoascus crustaceus TaxID=5088 RepID=UPI003743AC0A